jgi:hypothetical protein
MAELQCSLRAWFVLICRKRAFLGISVSQWLGAVRGKGTTYLPGKVALIRQVTLPRKGDVVSQL